MLCTAPKPKEIRDIICHGERDMAPIRRYVPWEAIFYDPTHLLLVWTGFREPKPRDQSFLAEMTDVCNATDAKAWEKFMTFWRHLAGKPDLFSLPSLESPQSGPDPFN